MIIILSLDLALLQKKPSADTILLFDNIIGNHFANPPVGSTSSLSLLNFKLLFPLSGIGYPREALSIVIPGRGM